MSVEMGTRFAADCAETPVVWEVNCADVFDGVVQAEVSDGPEHMLGTEALFTEDEVRAGLIVERAPVPPAAIRAMFDRFEQRERLAIVREALLVAIPAMYAAEFEDFDGQLPPAVEALIETLEFDLGVEVGEQS